MRHVLFAVLLVCAAIFHSASAAAYGSSVAVAGNTDATVTFGTTALDTVTLKIRTAADAMVTVNVVANLPLSLPTGVISMNFGISLQVSPANVAILSAEFTTPQLAAISGSNQVSVFKYDAAANYYGYIPAQSVNRQLVVTLPSEARASYFAVSFSTGTIIPQLYRASTQLVANVVTRLHFQKEFDLFVSSESNATLTVNHTEQNPTGVEPEGKVSLAAYWQIELDGEQGKEDVNATLRFAYDKARAAANRIKEETIRLAYFNTTTRAWTFLSNGEVDLQASVVSQFTTHFSTWGAYGESSNAVVMTSSTVAVLLALIVAILA